MHHRLLFSVLLCLALGSLAIGEDWPEFRGPTGMGLVREGRLPVHWTADKNVTWKTPIPGLGWSSPVVVNGRIYLTTAVPVPNSHDHLLEALCLDAKTGSILWEKAVFHQDGKTAPAINGKNSHASPTPLVAGKRLYVHFGHQGTACLDLDGQILWRTADLKYAPVHGNGATPILVGDVLVFSCDGLENPFVVALDKDTGKVRWKTPRSVDASRKFAFCTATALEVNGHTQIISPGGDAVCAYDPASGKEIWRVRYDGYSVIPKPVFGHGLVFVCTGYGGPSLLAIRPDGQGDVTDTHVAWRAKKSVPHTPSLLLVGDELYMVSDHGVASCLDAKTGKVHWQKTVSGNYSSSPLYGDGKIYLQSEEGAGVVLKAGKQFQELARNPLEERTLASYAAADGALFIRSNNHLYRVEER